MSLPDSMNFSSSALKPYFILLAKTDEELVRLQSLETKTSPVYDYSLGQDIQEIALRHFCLPIWYMQDNNITLQVIDELKHINF